MSTKDLRKGFSPSYFSLEDILACQYKVPCVTKVAIKNFGFLDPRQESRDLPVGSQVELPVWAAAQMSKASRSFLTTNMPKYYGERYRDALKAEPTVVDLNKMGPHYYQAGLSLCCLRQPEAENVSEMLPELLEKRLSAMFDSYSLNRNIMTTDDSTRSDIGNTLRHNFMDPLELKIFNEAKESAKELDKWLRMT